MIARTSLRPFTLIAATVLLAGGVSSVALAADAAHVPSSTECPAAELSRIYHGGTSSRSACLRWNDPEVWSHLYYADPALSTRFASDYRERTTIVQLRLRQLGYSPLVVDGLFGSQTRSTVIRYQNDNRLFVDGIVGEQTWRALFGLGRA